MKRIRQIFIFYRLLLLITVVLWIDMLVDIIRIINNAYGVSEIIGSLVKSSMLLGATFGAMTCLIIVLFFNVLEKKSNG